MIVSAIALTLMLFGAGDAGAMLAPEALLPRHTRGWTLREPVETFGSHDLYNHIDGAAEVYVALNVQQVAAGRYVKEGAPDILADVFHMATTADAYGAYRHDRRDGDSAGVGNESEMAGMGLAFWKAQYFVSIVALRRHDDAREALLELGRAIAEAIPGEGAPPDLVHYLPADHLDPTRTRYFHTHTSLNAYYFLSDENWLNLGRDTEGVLARYRGTDGADGASLLLIRYPSTQAAEEGFTRFRREYLRDSDAEGLAQVEDGRWTALRRQGRYLVGVFDATARQAAAVLADEVEKALQDRARGRT